MVRFETSLSPAECMLRILSVADIDSPNAPIGGKRLLCILKHDRFRLYPDKVGRRRGLSDVHFHGRVRSTRVGTIVEGRFPGLPPWAMRVLICSCLMITAASWGFFPASIGFLAGEPLSSALWMELVVLACLLAFGNFIASFTHIHIQDQEQALLSVLEELFGNPVMHNVKI